jgi:hypothetical protein
METVDHCDDSKRKQTELPNFKKNNYTNLEKKFVLKVKMKQKASINKELKHSKTILHGKKGAMAISP